MRMGACCFLAAQGGVGGSRRQATRRTSVRLLSRLSARHSLPSQGAASSSLPLRGRGGGAGCGTESGKAGAVVRNGPTGCLLSKGEKQGGRKKTSKRRSERAHRASLAAPPRHRGSSPAALQPIQLGTPAGAAGIQAAGSIPQPAVRVAAHGAAPRAAALLAAAAALGGDSYRGAGRGQHLWRQGDVAVCQAQHAAGQGAGESGRAWAAAAAGRRSSQARRGDTAAGLLFPPALRETAHCLRDPSLPRHETGGTRARQECCLLLPAAAPRRGATAPPPSQTRRRLTAAPPA